MGRAAEFLNRYYKQTAALTNKVASLVKDKEYNSPEQKAATKALSLLARLRRAVSGSLSTSYFSIEKYLINTLISQVGRHDKGLASRFQSKANEINKELDSLEKEISSAAKSELGSYKDFMTAEKEKVVKDIDDEIKKEIVDLEKIASDEIRKHRQETYSDLIGILRSAAFSGEDYRREDVQNLTDNLVDKNRILKKRQTELSIITQKLNLLHRHGKSRSMDFGRFSIRQRDLREEILERQNDITRIAQSLTMIRKEAKQVVSAAKKLTQSLSGSRVFGFGNPGVTLGPIEKFKVVFGKKSEELAQIETLLRILRAHGNTEMYKVLSDKVSRGETSIIRFKKQIFDRMKDIKRERSSRIQDALKEIDLKYSLKISSVKTEIDKASLELKDRRKELYSEMIKALEKIKSGD